MQASSCQREMNRAEISFGSSRGRRGEISHRLSNWVIGDDRNERLRADALSAWVEKLGAAAKPRVAFRPANKR